MIQGSSGTGAVGASASPAMKSLIYNDEVLESLATIILLGSKPNVKNTEALPQIKKMLYDFDIYMLSFMSDEDVEELYKTIRENGVNGVKLTDRKLKDKLFAIRDNARLFVSIAEKHNSVRAFIDRTMAEGNGQAALVAAFGADGCEYQLRQVGITACKKFLKQF